MTKETYKMFQLLKPKEVCYIYFLIIFVSFETFFRQTEICKGNR